MPRLLAAVGFAILLPTLLQGVSHAETWLPAGGAASWATSGNWSPATVPNGPGASAIFNSPTGSNRTINLDSGATGFTAGSLSFNSGDFTSNLTAGTAGSKLILDNNGNGASLLFTGIGTGNTTVVVPMVLNEMTTAFVDQTTQTSTAGAFNWTAVVTGTGGFTKTGVGLATFGTGTKTYQGPTFLNNGRLRISVLSQPSASSSFTINAGGQLTLITVAGNYTLGSGPLNLNGAGPTSGPFAVFPGAIRSDTGLVTTINNSVVLQSDTLLHVQGVLGSLTFPNTISGPGRLTLTAPGSNTDLGSLIVLGDNTYTGGTRVAGGSLLVGSSSIATPLASLGDGNVLIESLATKLSLQPGVLDAIADTATLSLAGGGTAGIADFGFAEIAAGNNEFVGGLLLGGIPQPVGTYGSPGSGAQFTSNEYFGGSGIITVIPEPSAIAMIVGGFGALLGLQRRRR